MPMIKVPAKSVDFFNENFHTILETGAFAEGRWNAQLSDFTKKYTSTNFCNVFNSNGSGILASLLILKKYYGYEHVFIQANTMYGVSVMAHTSGLNYLPPVSCDLTNFLMPRYEQVYEYIKQLKNPSKTVFVITHIGGWVNPDILKIANLCKEYKVALIEDCAHSLGSTLCGRHSGTYGLAGVYSLYATKAIPAGEGGLLITNDEFFHVHLQKFNIYDRFEQKQNIGCNFRISEIAALFAYAVLLQTEEIIANKLLLSRLYEACCDEMNIKYFHPLENGQRSNLYKFICYDDVNPIDSLTFGKINKRTSQVYDYSLGEDSSEISKRHICLPIWYDLDKSEIDEVRNSILK